jgi:bifunctional polynucleotide phosphatase/kinase
MTTLLVVDNDELFTRNNSFPQSVFKYEYGVMKGNRGCFVFDLDDTLLTRSLKVVNSYVIPILTQLVNIGFNIVIISNQKMRGIGDPKLKIKLNNVASILQVPFIAYCARGEDKYRKPEIGIIDLLPKEYGPIHVFVGDAAGRSGDHSDSDLQFASKAKITFYTPEQFFTASYLASLKGENKISDFILRQNEAPPVLTDKWQTMVILVGFPGSGKSTYATQVLTQCYHISQDKLESKTKCFSKTEEVLQAGYHVVIDRLNNKIADRQPFIQLAKKYKCQCICVHITTSKEESKHRNSQRVNPVPNVVYNVYGSQFENPTLHEGFDAIYTVL